MNNNSITAKITGVAGNTATATLEVSTDFHPIVRVAISSANPENTTRNLIFKVFQDSDEFVERCKPFIEKMESDCLKDEENYLVPYLRMWPPQEGERIFTLACMVGSGKDNCANQGDIYVEMPVEVSGLKMEIEKLDNAINAEISDWQAWTKDGKDVTYPATGIFLKLQRALFFLICLLMVASCHRKPKGDSELYSSMATESIKNDTISNHKKLSVNNDSIRFLALIELIEQMDLSQCDSIKPIKEDLLMVFLGNSNHNIISHFVEGFIFRFDYGYTKKPMMGLDVFTFDSEIYANRFAEIAFINETKEDKDSRVARFSNSIYRLVYQTDIPQSRIKYEKLLAEWDKIYWNKVY